MLDARARRGRNVRTAAAAALIVLLSLLAPRAHAEPATAGTVRLVKQASSGFDAFTRDPSRSTAAWMRRHFQRMVTYSSYFDSRTRWYPNAWAYQDLYAIYDPSALARRHPDWILRDGRGRRAFIQFDCARGRCPQYAADISNLAFRNWWIAQARATLRHGYRGLFIDDVNLLRRVSDGYGRPVTPVSPHTGRPISDAQWERLVTRFVEQIRRALPGVEIVHNSIWSAGGGTADPLVAREIRAADLVNVERGVNDPGLTGGAGTFSVNALLGFVDQVHQLGRGVVMDPYDVTPSQRAYAVAGYFLISDGDDFLGASQTTPASFSALYDYKLGAPQGARYAWQGLLRRDYCTGTVLLNPPGSPSETVTLPAGSTSVSGHSLTTVTLAAEAGVTVEHPDSCVSLTRRAAAFADPRGLL